MSVAYQSLGITFHHALKREDPKGTIMIDYKSENIINYQKLLTTTVRLATALTTLGVNKGDVVAISAENSWKVAATVIAGFYIGAKINIVNHTYSTSEFEHVLSTTKPVLVFCSSQALPSLLHLRSKLPPFQIILYDIQSVRDLKTLDELLEQATHDETFKPTELNPTESGALILTSSGTTGLPKCVVLSHANLRISMLSSSDPKMLGLSKTESVIAFLPFCHLIGISVILASILFGSKSVILDKYLPNQFLEIIPKYKITKLLVVPSVLFFLTKSELVNQYNLSSVRDIVCGGATLTKEMEEAIMRRFSNIKTIRQAYALTETSVFCTIIPVDCKKHGSVGLINPYFCVKICDPNTSSTLATNQIGEIRTTGEAVIDEYLNNEEATKNLFDATGFLKTGDLGYFDKDGFLYIVGRIKEMIKYKGFQVVPAELENLLLQHPKVKDAGVVCIPDEKSGELPFAFIVKQPNVGVTEKDIIEFVADNVANHKRLHGGVRFIQEIPRNVSGKVLRSELQKLINY